MKRLFLLSLFLLLGWSPMSGEVVRESSPHSQDEDRIDLSSESGFSLRTNMLFLAGATLNAGLEWRYDTSHGILLNGGFACWKWDNKMRRYYSWYLFPEYRWYLGDLCRWYVGLQGQYGELDIMTNTNGYKGEFYGGSVTGGYVLPIGRKLALDFNIGFGYTTFKHDKYGWSNNIRVIKEKDRSKNIIGPNQLGVSLVWHISR